MAKNRQGRINDEMRAALAEALRGVKDPRVSGLVSVVRCDVTNDLRYCKVYISVLGTEEQQKDAMKGLSSAAGWLRREAGQRLGLRYTPELVLILDDSIRYGAAISKILGDLSDLNETTEGESTVHEDDPS